MIYYAIKMISYAPLIYDVVIRIIVHLNDLLCNYFIYYAIKIISYAPK